MGRPVKLGLHPFNFVSSDLSCAPRNWLYDLRKAPWEGKSAKKGPGAPSDYYWASLPPHLWPFIGLIERY